MSDAKLTIEINLDKRTFSSENTATQTKQPSQPLPEGGMPWMLQVDTDPQEASDIRVDALTEQVETFNPVNATACSVIALDAWITDKVFETHDDTIYVVRVVNTSSHYVAEEICVDLEIDPKCAAVAVLLPDQHSLIEIQPIHQCIKCLAPRHYIDLKFVAISRGPMPGVFPVRACVTYDLVYWTRAQARTHARLEIEVHDECRPRRDPCRTPRHVPPDPGEFKPALQPQCPVELFKPCCEPAKSKPLPSVEDCGCDDGAVPSEATPSQQQAPTQDAAEATKPPLAVTPAATPAATMPEATAPAAIPTAETAPKAGATPTTPPVLQAPPAAETSSSQQQTNVEQVARLGDVKPPQVSIEADQGKEQDTMSNEKYGPKQDHHHHHEHHHPQHHHDQHPKDKSDPPADKKGCAPACSNADEFIPITEDCRLPEGGMLAFSYTFRKGFVANSNRGGRCVYGKHASNGKLECRLESLDDTVLVMDVTNHSHFHLKHVRVHGIRIFQNHEEVTQLLPSGHPVAQIIPNAVYIGSLPRGETKWVALSFITRGVAPGHYAVKFCVDYDIEACSVSAGINVEISCD